MDWNLYVITPLAGAVIGYFTNWLAIKMLFRPHEEKRVFGIRIPFTPGILPKERLRLSNRIGQTLSNHILTNDVMMTTVLQNERQILSFIDGYIERIKETPLTVAELALRLELAGEPDADGQASGLYRYVREAALGIIKSPDTAKRVSELVFELVIRLLKSENAGILALGVLEELKTPLMERVSEYVKGGALGELIGNGIDISFDKIGASDTPLSDVLPDRMIEFIKKLIRQKLPELADVIKNLPYENETVDTALRGLLNRVVDDSLGAMAVLFVNKDRLYSNIRFALFEYLSDDGNMETFTEKVGSAFNKLLSRGAASYIEMIAPVTRERLKLWLISIISRDGGFAERIINDAYEAAVNFTNDRATDSGKGTIYDAIKGIAPNFEDSLREYIGSRVSVFLTDSADSLVDSVSAWVKSFSDRFRIDTYVSGIKPENMTVIKQALLRFIKTIADKGLKTVFENVDIGGIAEEQINKFDMKTAEEITLSVVNRELKAITYFGGLLGLIIGFLPAAMRLLGL